MNQEEKRVPPKVPVSAGVGEGMRKAKKPIRVLVICHYLFLDFLCEFINWVLIPVFVLPALSELGGKLPGITQVVVSGRVMFTAIMLLILGLGVMVEFGTQSQKVLWFTRVCVTIFYGVVGMIFLLGACLPLLGIF